MKVKTLAFIVGALLLLFACVEKPNEPISNKFGSSKQPYHAPILSSLEDYANSVWEQNAGTFVENINFGETKQGFLPQGAPFKAYMFDALPGAVITVSVMPIDNNLDPVVALYGPRTHQGLWGEAITVADDIDGSTSAVISGYELKSGGWYLLLVASYDNTTGGKFAIGLGCQGFCEEPACPDEVCTLYCENGFLLDPNGCEVCACVEDKQNCECQTDNDCPANFVCDGCNCQEPSDCNCPNIYNPVCGVDGITYPNECEAECAGVEIAYQGECETTIATCESDSDCAEGEKCVDGLCMSDTNPDECNCSDMWDPVCGVDGITYPNQCQAECAGVEVAYQGECEEEEHCQPVCINISEPTGSDENTLSGWFDECTGELIKNAECERCWEDENGNEVCAQCEAVCGGIGTNAEGWYDSCTGYIIVRARCSVANDCHCPPVYQPVCGIDGTTYLNLCEIKCAGVPIARKGECPTSHDFGCHSNDECPFGYVCVDSDWEDNNGQANVSNTQHKQNSQAVQRFCMPGKNFLCEEDDDCPQGFRCVGFEIEADKRHCLPEVRECIRTGCHLEVCAPFEVSTSCDNWQPQFTCLDFARCEVLDDGTCGWIETEQYEQCVNRLAAGTACSTTDDCPQGFECINGICTQTECVCPEEGPEVCGTDCKTYKNICELACHGAEFLHFGECTPADGCSR